MRHGIGATTGALLSLGMATALAGLASVPAQAATPTCDGKKATIVGTADDDTLVGTQEADVIVGRGGDDVIRGRGGDDIICGGRGADTLNGGAGDDRLFGGKDKHGFDRGGTFQVGDTLRGGRGFDELDAGFDDPSRSDQVYQRDLIDYRTSAHGIHADLTAREVTGQGRDTYAASTNIGIVGSEHDDVMLGSEKRDYLVGLAGDDQLFGNGGRDKIFADDPGEYRGTNDRDEVHGGDGADQIESSGGRDTLDGDAGNDRILAYGKQPVQVHAGDGDDYVTMNVFRRRGVVADAGAGRDEIDLETELPDAKARKEWLRVDAGAGTVRLGDGNEGQYVGWQDVTFMTRTKIAYRGTEEPETVIVFDGRRLKAWTFGGDDDIVGSPGNDRIDAGEGDDRIDAQDGRDTCLNGERLSGCEE